MRLCGVLDMKRFGNRRVTQAETAEFVSTLVRPLCVSTGEEYDLVRFRRRNQRYSVKGSHCCHKNTSEI